MSTNLPELPPAVPPITVDQAVAVLTDFHEWRQDEGLHSTHWDTAVQRYEEHLRGNERQVIIGELRSLSLSAGVDAGRINELLDKLA